MIIETNNIKINIKENKGMNIKVNEENMRRDEITDMMANPEVMYEMLMSNQQDVQENMVKILKDNFELFGFDTSFLKDSEFREMVSYISTDRVFFGKLKEDFENDKLEANLLYDRMLSGLKFFLYGNMEDITDEFARNNKRQALAVLFLQCLNILCFHNMFYRFEGIENLLEVAMESENETVQMRAFKLAVDLMFTGLTSKNFNLPFSIKE